MAPYRESFIKGLMNKGLSEEYSSYYWDDVLVPFADYSFNKSHAVAYSTITYLCAYFKANYPVEFFCSLMTVRSQGKQPKLWAEKAPEYIQEAQTLGVKVHPPSVQMSENGFTIVDNEIYFGLSGVRSVGQGAANAIIKARGSVPFRDIWDFISRTGSKVNSKTIEALTIAGAFDSMGYVRKEILEKLPQIINYLPSIEEYNLHEITRKAREIENAKIELARLELDEKVKTAKKQAREHKKLGQPVPEDIELYLNIKETFELISTALSRENVDPSDLSIPSELIELYTKCGNARKLPALREKQKPEAPVLSRNRTLTVSVNELMDQANYIGCYLGLHPVRVVFPSAASLASIEEDEFVEVAGQVVMFKEILTRRGELMAVAQISDGTATAELLLFPQLYKRFKTSLPMVNDLLWISGRVEEIEPVIKLIPNKMKVHRREIENN